MNGKQANFGDAIKHFFLQSWSSAILAIVLLIIAFSAATNSFLSSYNLFNLSRTSTLYAFIAGAQLMVVVIGGMNLAVGAVGALSSVVLGILLQDVGTSIPVAVAATIGVGLFCGVINGILVVKLKLSGFIITLAMSFVYGGLAVGLSHGYPYTLPANFTILGRARVGPTSALFIIMIIFVVVLEIFYSRTRYGRNILATGGNESAAALSGIKVDKVKIACNALSCGLAALAAILWASRTGTAVSSTGSDWMLYSFAICAIGGISLNGGNFTGIGFFCAAWILTMIRNGLTMMKVDIYYERAFLGAIILIAVSVESIRHKLAENMK
jgi:Ribose/xylose/arabinose/galactoside ABC-type transport systems, permease components